MARKWHSKQSKKSALKLRFCFGSKGFVQPTWISLVGIAVFPKLLLRIQSYYSGSKAVIPDPGLFLRIQSFYSWSKVFILNPKLLLLIQSFYFRSKVFTLDPKLLLRPETKYDLIQFNIPIPEYEYVTSSSPFNMAAGLGRKRRPKT